MSTVTETKARATVSDPKTFGLYRNSSTTGVQTTGGPGSGSIDTESQHAPKHSSSKEHSDGLPGSLLYTTNTKRGSEPMASKRQFFTTVGSHPIIKLWYNGLSQEIAYALHTLDWRRFFVLKVGNPHDGYDPTLVVNVPASHNTTKAEAEEAALSCQHVLRTYKLSDIQVDIRRADEVPLALNNDLEAKLHSLHTDFSFANRNPPGSLTLRTDIGQARENLNADNLDKFKDNSGYEIAPKDELDSFMGTLGLHIKLGSSSKLYGLTCRHVAHRTFKEERFASQWIENHERYKFEDGNKKHEIIQACKSSIIELENKITAYLELTPLERLRLEVDMAKALVAGLGTAEAEIVHDVRDEAKIKQDICDIPKDVALQELKRIVDGVQENDARVIGHVGYLPPLETRNGFLRDWALVCLDDAKFKEPSNKIYFSPADLILAGKLGLDTSHVQDGKLRVSGCRPFDLKSCEDIDVVKRGAKSKLTFGRTNEIMAVARVPATTPTLAWEHIIIGRTPFSKGGDSGSAVVDLEGKFLGMVTSGYGVPKKKSPKTENSWEAESNEYPVLKLKYNPDEDLAKKLPIDVAVCDSPRYKGSDLTFVTPAHILFDDIKDITGSQPEIL